MTQRTGDSTFKITISATPTLIPHVIDYTGPSLSAETVDVTDMDSTSNYEENLPGKRMIGDLRLNLHFDPSSAVHQYLQDNVGVGGETILITHADDTTVTYTATITGCEEAGQQNDKLVVAVTIRGTGVPTFG